MLLVLRGQSPVQAERCTQPRVLCRGLNRPLCDILVDQNGGLERRDDLSLSLSLSLFSYIFFSYVSLSLSLSLFLFASSTFLSHSGVNSHYGAALVFTHSPAHTHYDCR